MKSSRFELRSADLATFVRSLGSRLRLLEHAVDRLASLQGDVAAPETQVLSEVADELRIAATYLGWLNDRLCTGCKAIEVVEHLLVEEEKLATVTKT